MGFDRMFGTIGRHKTKVFDEGGRKIVRYHSTDVIDFNTLNRRVRLNTGGWFTPTTKKRINQAAKDWGLGFKVSQRKGRWYAEGPGLTKRAFKDSSLEFEV